MSRYLSIFAGMFVFAACGGRPSLSLPPQTPTAFSLGDCGRERLMSASVCETFSITLPANMQHSDPLTTWGESWVQRVGEEPTGFGVSVTRRPKGKLPQTDAEASSAACHFAPFVRREVLPDGVRVVCNDRDGRGGVYRYAMLANGDLLECDASTVSGAEDLETITAALDAVCATLTRTGEKPVATP